MLASFLLAACMVPERLHLTELVFSNNAAVPAIRERLKSESFAAVAKSISADNVADRGWFSRDQLREAGYAAATKLTTGGLVEIGDNFQHGFVHVDEIREIMTCD